MGCFLNGCCYGSPSTLPWAVSYGPESMVYGRHITEQLIEPGAAHSASVHPVQLYSVFALLAVFLLIRWAWKRPHYPGSMLLLYPFLDGLQRFTTEFFRGESERPVAGLFTASQTVALAMVLGSCLIYGLLRLSLWRGSRPEAPLAPIQENPANTASV
jgi:phosphatidylglycerol:prolipoprotein diacylglycerol transferase